MFKMQYDNNSHCITHLLRTHWATQCTQLFTRFMALCYVIFATTLQ